MLAVCVPQAAGCSRPSLSALRGTWSSLALASSSRPAGFSTGTGTCSAARGSPFAGCATSAGPSGRWACSSNYSPEGRTALRWRQEGSLLPGGRPRHFAGRSTGRPSPRGEPRDRKEREASEAATTARDESQSGTRSELPPEATGTTTAVPSGPQRDSAAGARDTEAAAAAEGGAPGATAGGGPTQPTTGAPGGHGSGGGAPALFALPLYRKPAFPGFYQSVQVSEQEVLDFLVALRRNGQGDYVGGFMTKELPKNVAESDERAGASGDMRPSGTGGAHSGAGGGGTGSRAVGAGGSASSAASQSLRRDAGRVSSASELEEVGTVLQVINLTQYPNISGGQVVVMPHRRIRRTRVVSAPSPNVALAAVAVEYLEEPPEAEEAMGPQEGSEEAAEPKEPARSEKETSQAMGPQEGSEEAAEPKEPARSEKETSPDADQQDVKELHGQVAANLKELLKQSIDHKEQYDAVIRFYDINHSLKLADLVAGMSLAHSPAQRQELQAVLEEKSLAKRLEKVLTIVKRDLEFVQLQSKVKTQVEEKVTKDQRRVMLMEQMKHIMKELGIEKDDKEALVEQFQDALKDKTVPEEASKVIDTEMTKLGTLEPSSSEFNVCRTYLEWLTCLPWGVHTEENKDIRKAEIILDEDHYGLEDVKERILEHIAVSFLKESVQGKIMCMVGPPGVGKTSVGKSIARALDRKFYRFSVGGLHDVAELRGHRRTYVGAMPGKLIQCLKLTKSSNPVVLIDEIDKLGSGFRGDPSSALLEVLDPEQNGTFRDHYLDVPVDLSRVLFVLTANSIDSIPGPLLDRLEVIRIAGYVFEEKMAIAKQYLVPQIIEQSGLKPGSFDLEETALRKMIVEYAREAGVRQLNQLIEKVGRKVALGVVRRQKASEEEQTETIDPERVVKYIGQPLHFSDRLYAAGTPPGVITGLAWTSMGGATLVVEARGYLQRDSWMRRTADGENSTERQSSSSESGGSEEGSASSDGAEKPSAAGSPWGMAGSLKVTGQLGSVMEESSQISHTYARLFVRELDSANAFLDQAHVHLNVPEGGVPKDGPSAGVTMTTALLSLVLNTPARPDLAMTGELTLTGKVLKVGGIKEKVIAARREGMTTLLLPRQNDADYQELKDYVKAGITAHFVDHYDDVYRLAFDEAEVPALTGKSRGLPVISVSTPEEAAETAPDFETRARSSDEGSSLPQPSASLTGASRARVEEAH